MIFTADNSSDNIIGEMSQDKLQELLKFDFEKVATATNNFDLSNKLGQGGFGPVYKVPYMKQSYNILKPLCIVVVT